MVWIEGTEAHTEELVRRFDRAPKPMCYQIAFLEEAWAEYLRGQGIEESAVDPDAFVRWAYSRALAHRQPRYRAMAERWGVTITAEEVARVRSAADVVDIVAGAIAART
jgi:hypothetical protein